MRTTRLPLVGQYNNRLGSTAKDRRFKNCFIDFAKDEMGDTISYVVKRPGFAVNGADATDAGRGIYAWNGSLYKVCGDSVYKDGVEIEASLTNSSGLVQWTEEHVTDLLVFRDNDKIVTVNAAGTVTEQSDAQIPTSLVPGIVSLDTYIFVMDSNGLIYNCDLDDVTSWTSGNFITAKIEPDNGVAIFKHHDYVVALGDWTMEFFYDAANATGSPLLPIQGSTDMVGCAAGDSVYSDENVAVWVSRSRTGAGRVAKLSGMKVSYLSTPEIERILNQETTALDTARAFGLRIAGHHFYVLSLFTTSAITLVCDIDNGFWYEWTSDPGTETYFTGLASTYLDGVCYILDEDNGDDYKMAIGTYQDDGNDINVEIVTGKWDGRTTRQKFISRIDVIGDEQTSTSNITLEQTKDDYQNYQTARTIDMSTTTPAAHQFGAVQRSAYRIKHAANTPLRLEALDITYTLGSHTGSSY